MSSPLVVHPEYPEYLQYPEYPEHRLPDTDYWRFGWQQGNLRGEMVEGGAAKCPRQFQGQGKANRTRILEVGTTVSFHWLHRSQHPTHSSEHARSISLVDTHTRTR